MTQTPQITVACGAEAASTDPTGIYTKVFGGEPVFHSLCLAWRGEIENTTALYNLLQILRDRGPAWYVALGKPPREYDPLEAGPMPRAKLDPVRQSVLIFDVDGAEGLSEDATGAEVVSRLPEWLRETTWIFQRTGSAMTGQGFRGRLWAALTGPVQTTILKNLANRVREATGLLLDTTVYGNGLVFTADPLFRCGVDPVAAAGLPRWELVLGPTGALDANLVDAAGYEKAAVRNDIRDRPHGLTPARFQGYIKAAFEGMMADIAKSTHPDRTETFKAKGVRMVGLCRGHGIDPAPFLKAMATHAERTCFGKPAPHIHRLVVWCLQCTVPPLYPRPILNIKHTKETEDE